MRSIITNIYYRCVNITYTNVRPFTISSIKETIRVNLGIDEFGEILRRDNILRPIAAQLRALR